MAKIYATGVAITEKNPLISQAQGTKLRILKLPSASGRGMPIKKEGKPTTTTHIKTLMTKG